MEELLRLVGVLRERIDDHRAALSGNEALTRYALIDPLLRSLGWNTEDPLQVVPEYSIPSSPSKSADYALFAQRGRAESDVPEVIVEAKKLGADLKDAAQQAVNYCTVDGFEYFVVTDGRDWQLFGTRRKGNLKAKQIVQFDLRSDSMADVCRKALALWRQGFEESAVAVAPTHGSWADEGKTLPVLDGAVSQPKAWTGAGSPNTAPSTAKVGKEDWVSLSVLSPQSGTKPAELRVPTGVVVAVGSWRSLMVEVTKWLIGSGSLSSASEPLRVGQRHVLAPWPEHPKGKRFTAPGEAGGLYVEMNFSAKDVVRHTCSIAKHAGVDAGLFAVRVQR